MSQFGPSGAGRGPEDGDEEFQSTSSYGEQGGGGGGGGEGRQFNYSPEERYWTDYLRIAAPVLGVILMLGLVWFWLGNLIGNDEDATPTPDDTAGVPDVVVGASPTPEDENGLTIVETPNVNDENDTTETPTELGEGVTAVVSGTGGTGLNLRDSASADGVIVATLSEDTEVTITGPSQDADGYTWWPVQAGADEGYVVEDFITPAN